MKSLYLKYKPRDDLRALSDKELALLANKFYKMACVVKAAAVKEFYEKILKEKHELLKQQSKDVLLKSSYNIYPDLGIIQFLVNSSPINEALLDVPTWVKKTYGDLREEELLLAVGFWLADDTYATLQVSQGAWFV